MDQPGKVANPARGQLIRENEYFPVPVRAWEFGIARRVRQSRPASVCSSTYSGWIWCFFYVRDSSRVPRRRPFVYLKPPYAIIWSVPSLSSHAIAYRWRSLPRVRRHRASKPQGSSSNGCCLFMYHHRPMLFFSHTPRPFDTPCKEMLWRVESDVKSEISRTLYIKCRAFFTSISLHFVSA